MAVKYRVLTTASHVIDSKGVTYTLSSGVITPDPTLDVLRQFENMGLVNIETLPVFPWVIDDPAAVNTALSNASPHGIFRAPFAGDIVGAFAFVNGAPATGPILVDITKGVGTAAASIFKTSSGLQIDVSGLTAHQSTSPYSFGSGTAALASVAVAQNDLLTVNVTGSHANANGLKVGVLVRAV